MKHPSLKWLCELDNHMDSIGYPDVRLSFYTPNYFLLGTFGSLLPSVETRILISCDRRSKKALLCVVGC